MRKSTSLFVRLLNGTLAAVLLLSVAGLFPSTVHADPPPTPYLVKDINTRPTSSSPSGLTEVGGIVFFSASTGEYDRGLWKSDGTEAGTVQILVRDPDLFTNHNGTLFFRARYWGGGSTGLWKSDGTESGTVLIKNIYVDSLTSTTIGLFFKGSDNYLWISDGTEVGTMMVKNIAPDNNEPNLNSLVEAGGTLYFFANDGVNGRELWKSDGTTSGTQIVKDIRPQAGI